MVRRFGLVTGALILALLITRPVFADTSYIVQPGDNLTKIAAKFGVSVNAILETNHLSNPNNIRIGQTLTIPDGAPAPAAPTGTITYIVQPGDSVSRVSAKFGISIDALMTANNLRSTTLQIGQTLIIPGQVASSPDSIYKRIQGTSGFTARVRDALDWLQTHDPEAYNRVNTYITSIIASPYRRYATATPLANGGCLVRALARAGQSIPMVAALLYHEASHCYQFATSGVPDHNKEAEVFAYSEQLAFMERNGFPAEELEYYRKILDYYASQPDDGSFVPPPNF